jgi:hypothetical protein
MTEEIETKQSHPFLRSLKVKTDTLLAALMLLGTTVAFVIYNWQMLLGQYSPNAVSWGVWAFITILNFTSYKAMSKDWVKSLLPTLNSTLCVLTFVFLLIFHGRLAALNAYDDIALALGIASCVVWWRTKSEIKAQILLQVCILIGFIPTYISVWKNPGNESLLCWVIWAATFVIQIVLVLLRWRGQKMDLLYPVNCGVLHSVLIALILRNTI